MSAITATDYAPHIETLGRIALEGWGVRVRRTPVGLFCRLERGILFRGSRTTGWWWRPTLAGALAKLLREAQQNPRRAPQRGPQGPAGA
jgi:hypothetical protein